MSAPGTTHDLSGAAIAPSALTDQRGQLELFPSEPLRDWWGVEAERAQVAWERRALCDMAAQPLVCCFPGFMGAVCERLVGKGLATKQDAGFMSPPPGIPPKKLKKWWRAEDYPQFRYALSTAGRAGVETPAIPQGEG